MTATTNEPDFPVHGDVAPGFERVRDVFQANFRDDIEVGAGFSAYLGDQLVVDLWGGFTDRECTQPWQRDTLVNVYSTTKGIASLAFAQVVEAGLLDYDAPVSDIWPEFRAASNGLTIGQFLSHQSGVPGTREKLSVSDLYDFAGMCERLAAEEPFWEPGTAAGYHAINWGFLAGELVRRVSGEMIGQWLRTRCSEPLGADFHIGLPVSEHHRVASVIGPNHARIQPDLAALLALKMPEFYPVALQNPTVRPFKDVGSAEWRQADIAAANGHGTAQSVARLYRGALSGELFNADTAAKLTHLEVGDDEDLVLGRPMRRGRGVIINTEQGYGPSPVAYGHAGAGGSVGFADPANDLSVGYVMNQMQPGIETDTRGKRLIDALYTSLASAG